MNVNENLELKKQYKTYVHIHNFNKLTKLLKFPYPDIYMSYMSYMSYNKEHNQHLLLHKNTERSAYLRKLEKTLVSFIEDTSISSFEKLNDLKIVFKFFKVSDLYRFRLLSGLKKTNKPDNNIVKFLKTNLHNKYLNQAKKLIFKSNLYNYEIMSNARRTQPTITMSKIYLDRWKIIEGSNVFSKKELQNIILSNLFSKNNLLYKYENNTFLQIFKKYKAKQLSENSKVALRKGLQIKQATNNVLKNLPNNMSEIEIKRKLKPYKVS